MKNLLFLFIILLISFPNISGAEEVKEKVIDYESMLLNGIHFRDIKRVKKALENGANPNFLHSRKDFWSRDLNPDDAENNRTAPLHDLLIYVNKRELAPEIEEILDILLENGAMLLPKEEGNDMRLHQALAIRASEEEVEKLMDEEIDLFAKDIRGLTVFHWAALTNNLSFFKEALKESYDLNIEDDAGTKPVHYAITSSNEKIFNLLLNYSTINASKEMSEDFNFSPLYMAVGDSKSHGILKTILSMGVDVNKKGKNGDTALSGASIMCNYEAAKELLKAGAIIYEKDEGEDAMSPLTSAIIGGSMNSAMSDKDRLGCVKIVKLFLEQGVDFTKKYRQGMFQNPCDASPTIPRDENGHCFYYENKFDFAMRMAENSGNHKVLQEILKYVGPELINQPLNVPFGIGKGDIPLVSSIKLRNVSIVSTLIASGADVNKVNTCGKTPLAIAKEPVEEYVKQTFFNVALYGNRHAPYCMAKEKAAEIESKKEEATKQAKIQIEENKNIIITLLKANGGVENQTVISKNQIVQPLQSIKQ